jgi:hypothetical protein
MRLALFSTNAIYFRPVLSRAKATRGTLFAFLLESMHLSRRRQAERIIRQYEHLIAGTDTADAPSNGGGEADVGH